MYVRCLMLVAVCFMFVGCSAVEKTTTKTGEYIGEGANAAGGLTEGAAAAVQEPLTNAENPLAR